MTSISGRIVVSDIFRSAISTFADVFLGNLVGNTGRTWI